MSDEDAQSKGGNEEPAGGSEFKPIETQEDLDRLLSKRLERERSKFADYDELKAKAEKFDQAEEANLSELERERKARESAEKRIAEFEAKEQRAAWAKEITKGSDIPVDALRGSTKEELEEHFQVLSSLITKPPVTRTATPPGKPARDGEKGRAAAALRELRQG